MERSVEMLLMMLVVRSVAVTQVKADSGREPPVTVIHPNEPYWNEPTSARRTHGVQLQVVPQTVGSPPGDPSQ